MSSDGGHDPFLEDCAPRVRGGGSGTDRDHSGSEWVKGRTGDSRVPGTSARTEDP